jgi:hypothetical protein
MLWKNKIEESYARKTPRDFIEDPGIVEIKILKFILKK